MTRASNHYGEKVPLWVDYEELTIILNGMQGLVYTTFIDEGFLSKEEVKAMSNLDFRIKSLLESEFSDA